jgi:hypothetical protein
LAAWNRLCASMLRTTLCSLITASIFSCLKQKTRGRAEFQEHRCINSTCSMYLEHSCTCSNVTTVHHRIIRSAELPLAARQQG